MFSQTLSFFLGAVFIYRNRREFHLDFTMENFRIDRKQLMTLVKLGVPMAIKNAAIQFSRLFVNSWVNSFGVAVSAVSGVGSKLNTVSNTFSDSVNTAGASMVGQNIGAQKYKRVTRIIVSTFAIDMTLMTVCIVLFVSFPTEIFRLFTDDGSILPIVTDYIPVGILIFLGSAFRTPANVLLNGSGNYRINFIAALLDGMVNRIGLGLLLGLALDFGYVGFWIGDALASFTPFLIGSVYYLSGLWKTRKYIVGD